MIRWLTGCQGLTGKCSDFELYSVVVGKPMEVTKSLTCSEEKAEPHGVREFWTDCSLCMLDADIMLQYAYNSRGIAKYCGASVHIHH